MKIEQLTTTNVGGIADGTVDVTDHRVVAFAGPNGAGKSRLLTCFIAPWLRDTPSPRDLDQSAVVSLRLRFTEEERAFLDGLNAEAGWGDTPTPEIVDFRVEKRPTSGVIVEVTPRSVAVQEAFNNVQFLARHPSLDVLFLPAERRLLSTGPQAIDLSQLLPETTVSTSRNSRATAFSSAGRMDDNEFEAYAKALCVAAHLPSEGGGRRNSDGQWSKFKASINQLLAPKELLDLSQENPATLRVRLPDGQIHGLDALSSGERQAITIVSRVFRAGEQRTVTIIDEPDVHLHPQLSGALFRILAEDTTSQLIVATHSPAILDHVPTEAIWEVRHGQVARPLLSETERMTMYRAAGFRASELTQSDLLVLTEGDSDREYLTRVEPVLSRAAFRSAGGRARVLEGVSSLVPFDLPVLGVIDGDVLAPAAPEDALGRVFQWPMADIEAVFLADEAVLSQMAERDLVKKDFDLERLVLVRDELVASMMENAVAETAQRLARSRHSAEFPSPRGDRAVERLGQALTGIQPLEQSEFDELLKEARSIVEAAPPLKFVRGKWILGKFAAQVSAFRDGDSLLLATARGLDKPPAGMGDFLEQARSILGISVTT